ncbi:class I SAM-dependent methyltransferase [Enterobacter hormaechei]|uniref:class I SAM-dependent methyltransferase n=1 Tax=Enterobacter hormaechei TaxID=158836 RepID=UPI0021B29BC3|nr:class I SAM-dependent methyltransferase [Enterobacter hormaechei]MCT7304398.1 class I SAM-dependent methyltransferase [Enterobacter hormaechei]
MMFQDRLFSATVMPDQDWWQALWPDPDGVIQALRIEPGMAVVDLGCGYGYFTTAIARQAAPGTVIGLDLDPAMLEQAQVACKELANCAWQLGDAMALSHLIPDPVDYVLIANTFHGVPDKTALAREVAAALKPDGRFAIVNWHPIPREQTPVLGKPRGPGTELRMSPEQTRATVEPAGFTLEALIELPPYHYGAIFIRTQ